MEIDGSKRRRIDGPFYDLGPPEESNPIVPFLEYYDVERSQMIALMAKANEIQNLDTKYRDYQIFLVGVPPDMRLSTGISYESELGETIIDCWQIAIYWGIDGHYVTAVWNNIRQDFVVSIEMGCLNSLRPRAEVKRVTDGLALLQWVQERMSKGGRPAGLPKELEAIHSDYVYLCACHLYLYSDDARPSARNMADFYGVDRSSLYRHLKNNIGISFSDLKAECERQVKTIAVEELPKRFRSYIKQKRSEQATDTLTKK